MSVSSVEPCHQRLEPPPPPIWFPRYRTPACRHGHAYISFRERGMVLELRGDTIVFLTCEHCKPKTYALGVLAMRPSPFCVFFAVTRRQLEDLRAMPDDTPIADMIEYLGYDPPEANEA